MRFARIIVNPAQMGGQACIRGLRIPVATVVEMVADGMTVEEIVAAFPDLEPADVAEALHCAAVALEERVLPLDTGAHPNPRERVGALYARLERRQEIALGPRQRPPSRRDLHEM